MNAIVEVWDRAKVQELIERSDAALARAILRIYNLQTASEQSEGSTREHNGIGFTAYDAPFLSAIASKLPQYNMRLTERQIARVRPMMKKYWKQLLHIIEGEGKVVSYRVRPDSGPSARSDADAALPKGNTAQVAWGSF